MVPLSADAPHSCAWVPWQVRLRRAKALFIQKEAEVASEEAAAGGVPGELQQDLAFVRSQLQMRTTELEDAREAQLLPPQLSQAVDELCRRPNLRSPVRPAAVSI